MARERAMIFMVGNLSFVMLVKSSILFRGKKIGRSYRHRHSPPAEIAPF
jgi:hypothetical protein